MTMHTWSRRGEFDVWAPSASRVELVLGTGDRERVVALWQGDDAWFAADGDALDAALREARRDDGDVDFGYRLTGLDGAGGDLVVPSPRARRLPGGVHGRSRTFDPADFAWTDAAWTGRQLAGAVVYELHLGIFTPGGTLDSAIERLDHLADLGVDLVELMPVNAFNGEHGWGYDGVAWFAVHEAYGGPRAYQRFVDACHARGLGVVQDVVYNHFGPSGNYLGLFGPYLLSGSNTGWGDAVNLDGAGSDVVRRYILDNAAMWFEEFHVDALRLDAVHALRDTRAVPLLEELARESAARSAHLGRPLTLIAESDLNDPRLIAPREAGGYGLDAQWSDDFHHAVHAALTGEADGYYGDFADEGVEGLAHVLQRGWFHDGARSSFRDRLHGRPLPHDTPAWRLVTCIQNHDQVGNRARGDRFGETLDDDRLVVGAALLLTAPFTPMLFMGDEWGATTPFAFFSSHPEADLAAAVTNGRFREFERMGWDRSTVPDPQAPSTFEASKLDWNEASSPRGRRLRDAYRSLIRLRRARPELTHPWLHEQTVTTDAAASTLVVVRGNVQLAFNLGDASRFVDVRLTGDAAVAWASGEAVGLTPDARRVTLPPWSAAVVTG